MFSRIIHKISIHYKICLTYVLLKYKLSKKADEGEEIFFDLSDIRQGPYYYPLIFSFHESGYNICISDRYWFIGHSFGPARYIYDLKRIRIARRKSTSCNVVITDQKQVFLMESRSNKTVFINYNDLQESDFIIPYPMHPNAYHLRYFERVSQHREQSRSARIIFSGNVDEIAYSNPIISHKYQKINRVQLINFLFQILPPGKIIPIRNKIDLDLVPITYFDGAILYLWKWSPSYSEGLEIRVENDKWLNFLAGGDFFLCCPGIVIPLSHNAIECMSVGTIPIIEYKEYFHPELIDGVNCISFSSQEELRIKIKKVLAFSQAEITNLRNNVIIYYETYLRNSRTADMILSTNISKPIVSFYNEVVI